MDARTEKAHNDLPCIWMQAGVLNYRLCDRNYDCEHCDLFRVLRGGTAAPADGHPVVTGMPQDPVTAYVCRLMGDDPLRLDRPHSAGHFWIDAREPKRSTLGLDGYVWRLLFPVDDVVLPKAGVWLKRGGSCGWIERRHAVIPLTAPISGEVEAVNDAYRAAVRSRHGANGRDDWLLRLEPHELVDEVPDLLRGEQLLLWYLEQIQILKRHLADAITPPGGTHLGLTMGDGGVLTPDLESVLGPERFQRLVDEIFYTKT